MNGWVAKDLLTLQVYRTEELADAQQRTNQLLALAIAVVALAALAVTFRPLSRGPETHASAPPVPNPPDPLTAPGAEGPW